MTVGTRSVLFGAHCAVLHPFLVAAAWWRLYGFPCDPRLWVAFFVHDLGYWGSPNMDGPEGERHVLWGARVMSRLFDRHWIRSRKLGDRVSIPNPLTMTCDAIWGSRTTADDPFPWRSLCLYHSRFWAKRAGRRPSRLCLADKLAIALTPAWLYLPMVRWSGEIHEYMALAQNGRYATMAVSTATERRWYADVQQYVRRWVYEHKDGREDQWTPAPEQR